MKSLALLPVLAASAFASEGTPHAVPLTHYQPLIERSPFAPATAPAPVQPTASFAKDYYIAGVAEMGGKAFVTFASRDEQKRFSLQEGDSYAGMTLTRVEWSTEPSRTRAVLRQGTELGEVSFDEAALKAEPTGLATPQAVAADAPSPAGAVQHGMEEGGGNRRRNWRGGNDEERRARRNYWRNQRRAAAWYGAQQMQQMHQQQGHGQGGQNNVHQRQQPINAPRQ